MSAKLQLAADRLFAHAMRLAGAQEDHPWGERVAKVNGKIFAFFGRRPSISQQLTLAVKLPESGTRALDLGFCEPTNYGMGKHGWVTARFVEGDTPPHELLCTWIEESHRAVSSKPKSKSKPRVERQAPKAAAPRSKVAKQARSAKACKASAKPAASRARSPRS